MDNRVAGAFVLAVDTYKSSHGMEEERENGMNAAVQSIETKRKQNNRVDENSQLFVLVMLAGMGLSFECLLNSLLLRQV